MKIKKIGQAGFTLIEVIASMVIMSIVAVIAAMGLVSGVEAYVATRTNSAALQKAEYALNRMKLEFMNMTSVTAADSNSITFTSENTERPPGTVYTLARVGNQINLTVAGAANPLLTGVGTGGAFFTYRNNVGGTWGPADGFGGTSICTSNSLHSITINLNILSPGSGRSLNFTTSINPRNNECANCPLSPPGNQ